MRPGETATALSSVLQFKDWCEYFFHHDRGKRHIAGRRVQCPDQVSAFRFEEAGNFSPKAKTRLPAAKQQLGEVAELAMSGFSERDRATFISLLRRVVNNLDPNVPLTEEKT